MKTDLFVNAIFPEKDGSLTATARLRGVTDAKSFKLPKVDPALELKKNDGIAVELTGKFKVSDKYVTPEQYKILQVVPGAYVPASKEMSPEEYFQSLSASEPAEDVAYNEEEGPF